MSNLPAFGELAPVVSDEDVLVAARGFADQIADAELGLIAAGLEWAHRNPGRFMVKHKELWADPSIADFEEWETVAMQGCVLVDEMSLPEFAYASGLSETVVRSLVHDAVVMFYRFPRTWARMAAGHIPVWRARLVPRYGSGVSVKAAAYIDRHLDQPGFRFTRPQVQRLIDEARLRFVPDEVAAEAEQHAEQRCVEVDTRSAAHLGLGAFEGCLDLPDALDLEAAITYGAAKLKEAGSTEPLHVRRAHALGDLARAAQTADPSFEGEDRPHWDGKGVPRTGVKMYIHLNHTALKCTCTPADDTPGAGPIGTKEPSTRSGSVLEYMVRGPGAAAGPGVTPTFLLPDSEREDDRLGEVARVESTGTPTVVLDPGLIRKWFTRETTGGARAGPKISVRQVVDPEDFVSTEAYEVPERLKDAVAATHSRTCVFPYCSATSSRADCDHTTPFDKGGPTCICNLAPLCRYHHRVKTHGQHHDDHKWTYAHVGRDTYVWSGPNGIRLLRTDSGTHVLPGDIFTFRPADGASTSGVRQPDGTFTAFDENHRAFDVVTDPLALPRPDGNGHPEAADPEVLLRQAREYKAQDLDAFVYFDRYAARDASLLRPNVEFYEYEFRPDEQPKRRKTTRKRGGKKSNGERFSEMMLRRWEQNCQIIRRDPFPEAEPEPPEPTPPEPVPTEQEPPWSDDDTPPPF